MDIYAIRKNKCAGVYTNKDIFEYIKEREHKCSIRIFDSKDEKEALKWAGVSQIDDVPSLLKMDLEFNNLLNSAKCNTKCQGSESGLSKTEFEGALHRTKGLSKKVEIKKDLDCSEESKKVDENKNFHLDKVIEELGKIYSTLLIRTENFGDIYYLNDLWYYEKPWDVEYNYSDEELIQYGYIEFKRNTEVVCFGDYLKVYNYYTTKNAESIIASDIFDKCNEFIVLNKDEIRGIVPMSNILMQWDVSGELNNFNSNDEKSERLKKIIKR